MMKTCQRLKLALAESGFVEMLHVFVLEAAACWNRPQHKLPTDQQSSKFPLIAYFLKEVFLLKTFSPRLSIK